jgi:hypothetical protein
MLPLGIFYFTVAVTALAFSLAIALMPLAEAINGRPSLVWWNDVSISLPLWSMPITIAVGLGLLLLTLHGARLVGAMHGAIAKHLLVRGG